MTDNPPRVCPECGADRWAVREAKRILERNYTLKRDVEKLAAENGVLAYQSKVAERDFQERLSFASRKVVRQARAIVRLEKKLRDSKLRPYEDTPIGETSTGAEYDSHGTQ